MGWSSGAILCRSDRLKVDLEELNTLAGQERLYDITTFNSWIAAKAGGNQKLAAMFESRFRDEYRKAFSAWLNTDPFNNPKALPGRCSCRNTEARNERRLSD